MRRAPEALSRLWAGSFGVQFSQYMYLTKVSYQGKVVSKY